MNLEFANNDPTRVLSVSQKNTTQWVRSIGELTTRGDDQWPV
jgi:hypothetical protein